MLNNYPGWLAGMIADNQCGFAVEPDSPTAFADALERAADDRESLRAMGSGVEPWRSESSRDTSLRTGSSIGWKGRSLDQAPLRYRCFFTGVVTAISGHSVRRLADTPETRQACAFPPGTTRRRRTSFRNDQVPHDARCRGCERKRIARCRAYDPLWQLFTFHQPR